MEINGSKAIVTGGVSGLGRAMVEAIADRGGKVTVFDNDDPGLKKLKQSNPDVDIINCDVSDYDNVASSLSAYHQKHGATDILINNAGILHSEPLVSIGPSGIEKHKKESWEKVISHDLSSVFYMSVWVIEKMIATRTRGLIINISSVSAAGNPGQSAYSAAKAAVNALTATWAKELGPIGIRVMAVSPGFTDTVSTRQALHEEVLRETIKKVPLRRLGLPSEIIGGVLSIIENDFFHGKVLEVDGGLVL